MRELIRTNDLVLISYVSHLLQEGGVDFQVLDSHMSAVEGSIGAIPRRIVVPDDNHALATRLLGNASITIGR
jgi:hypothetical protein